ncbi:MAG: release factor glutamine methyltransferase [Myxococcota bacterium]|jgi:release factor glutamine methyltransferase
MSEIPKTWTVLTILQWTTAFFDKKGVDAPRLAAELLLAEVLSCTRIQLYVRYDHPLDPTERDAYRALVKRRAGGEPVQYILGRTEFWSIPLAVERGVLIPRSDTECLIEEALVEAKRLTASGIEHLHVADVGTGSGAIAIAIAKELPDATVVAGDIAETPLTLAPKNAEAAEVGARVSVHEADGLAALWQAADRVPFHIVLSNPPYIRAGDHPGLMREVRDWEPSEALVSGDDGLDMLRQLIADLQIPDLLHPDGVAIFEFGDREQAEQLVKLLGDSGFPNTRVRNDYGARPRAVVARRENG